jgi:hypothetical protein
MAVSKQAIEATDSDIETRQLTPDWIALTAPYLQVIKSSPHSFWLHFSNLHFKISPLL